MKQSPPHSGSRAEELPHEEWNFVEIPEQELPLAEIYEYSREVEVVREGFKSWLDSSAVVMEESITNEGAHDSKMELSPLRLGLTVREIISAEELPREIMVDGREFNLSWETVVDLGGSVLGGHNLFSIVSLLAEWPKPFVIARRQPAVSSAIKRFLLEKMPPKSVFLPEQDTFYKSFEHLKPITLVIDCSSNLKALQKDFAAICSPFLRSSRGRKKGQPLAMNHLRQLAAYRLHAHGYGEGKALTSYSSLEREMQRLDSGSERDKILPNYADQSGFIEAGNAAQQRMSEYKKYRVMRLRGGFDIFEFPKDGEPAASGSESPK